MSQSTNATIAYGVPVDEDSWSEWDEDEGEDDPPPGPAQLVYYGKPEDGINVQIHCSDNYHMYILIIDGTGTTAWRGTPQRIELPPVDPTWNQKLLDYCKKYELKTIGDPGWWLCSYWG